MIKNYDEFCAELLKSGFSMGGGNAKGIYSIVPFDWTNQDEFDTPVRWHTEIPETDPWQWRMRVLEERSDIAYGKLFFKTSGYITREWYPYFLAARRGGDSFSDAYFNGEISAMEKRIYEVFAQHGKVAAHDIRPLAGIAPEDKSKAETALTALQMKMYITICGQAQKVNKFGEPYGWYSAVLCPVEQFWGEEVFKEAANISQQEAENKIRERILQLNPAAKNKDIMKFIYG